MQRAWRSGRGCRIWIYVMFVMQYPGPLGDDGAVAESGIIACAIMSMLLCLLLLLLHLHLRMRTGHNQQAPSIPTLFIAHGGCAPMIRARRRCRRVPCGPAKRLWLVTSPTDVHVQWWGTPPSPTQPSLAHLSLISSTAAAMRLGLPPRTLSLKPPGPKLRFLHDIHRWLWPGSRLLHRIYRTRL